MSDSKAKLGIKKLRAQRDHLKFTIDQLIEIPEFRDRWDQSAKAISELDLLISLLEADLQSQRAS